MEIYKKYNCVVIADEIWADIVLPGHKHIPAQSVSAMRKRAQLPFMLPQRPLILPDLSALTMSFTIAYLRDRGDKAWGNESL